MFQENLTYSIIKYRKSYVTSYNFIYPSCFHMNYSYNYNKQQISQMYYLIKYAHNSFIGTSYLVFFYLF